MNNESLWVKLPIKAQRIADTLTDVLLDGMYLAAYPGISYLLHVLVPVLGFASGWLHPGFKTVFSESMVFMIAAGAIGMMSARMGFLFVISFAVGDFLLAPHKAFYDHGLVRNFVEVRLPLVIEYALLYLLLVGIPITVKLLLATFRPPKNFSEKHILYLAAGATAVLTGIFVFCWSQVVPLLLRPVFIWHRSPGAIPSTMAMPLQTQWYFIVGALSLIALLRVWLHNRLDNSGVANQLAALKERLFTAQPVIPLTAQIPPLLFAVISAVWVVFLFSGMLTSWLQVVILIIIFAVLSALRNGIVRIPLGPLPDYTQRIPYIYRFILGLIVIVLIANQVIGKRSSGDGFEAIIITVILSTAVFFLLSPPNYKVEGKPA